MDTRLKTLELLQLGRTEKTLPAGSVCVCPEPPAGDSRGEVLLKVSRKTGSVVLFAPTPPQFQEGSCEEERTSEAVTQRRRSSLRPVVRNSKHFGGNPQLLPVQRCADLNLSLRDERVA